MKHSVPFLLCTTFLLGLWVAQVPAQDSPPTPKEPTGETAEEIRGYALGYTLAARYRQGIDGFVDPDAVGRGFADGIRGEAKIPESEVFDRIYDLRAAMIAKQVPQAEQAKALEGAAAERDRLKAGLSAKDAGVKKTESGLYYKVLSAGPGGPKPKATETVTVHYVGKLIDGKTFDSSRERGQPTSFPLNRVIKGWTEGLQLMSAGDKYEFYIPYELAYGAEGRPPTIPMYATLVFEVELIKLGE